MLSDDMVICKRTSVYDDVAPCEEAERVEVVVTQQMRGYDADRSPAWSAAGRNHRRDGDLVFRDVDETRWVVRIPDIAALAAFAKKHGELVVGFEEFVDGDRLRVEIYDDYRE